MNAMDERSRELDELRRTLDEVDDAILGKLAERATLAKKVSALRAQISDGDKGGFSPLFYKGMPEAGRDVFRARLKARFTYINQHLKNNEYLLGDDYTIADAHLYVVSNWASWTNFDLSPYSSLLAFRERVGSRPAVIAALTTEGLVPWPVTQPH